jgi:FtsP/CotA-like multicopper oxidase with cupredoxin domain
VLRTIINSGQRLTYNVEIPADQPPGLYWYHPHVHGITDGTNQGGASGAIIVEGIQNIQPAVAGLPEQTLIVRDQPVPGGPFPLIGSEVPSWDITVNYVTISSCQDPQPCTPHQFVGDFKPAVMQMKPGERQFWRVVDATNHIPLNLQLLYDGVPQELQIVALDGVPVNSDAGTEEGRPFTRTDILLEPSARAEFIIKGPSASVKNAVLQTLRVSTGPGGDNHPERPLFTIQSSPDAPEPPLRIPGVSELPDPRTFGDLADATPTKTRKLYLSEVLQDSNNPLGPTNFFLTADGTTPTLFTPEVPPAIVTRQGSVEDWTIENQAMEDHAFHLHNLHFLLLAINGVPVPREQQQYLDVVDSVFWDGVSAYPTVTIRLDFRGADIGDLIYECNYLFHADFGMRAIIRVLPKEDD